MLHPQDYLEVLQTGKTSKQDVRQSTRPIRKKLLDQLQQIENDEDLYNFLDKLFIQKKIKFFSSDELLNIISMFDDEFMYIYIKNLYERHYNIPQNMFILFMNNLDMPHMEYNLYDVFEEFYTRNPIPRIKYQNIFRKFRSLTLLPIGKRDYVSRMIGKFIIEQIFNQTYVKTNNDATFVNDLYNLIRVPNVKNKVKQSLRMHKQEYPNEYPDEFTSALKI